MIRKGSLGGGFLVCHVFSIIIDTYVQEVTLGANIMYAVISPIFRGHIFCNRVYPEIFPVLLTSYTVT